MKKASNRLTRKIGICLTQEDYVKMEASFKESTKRKLAEYIRSVLLKGPVTFFTRDKSLDELVEELIPLRKDLSEIKKNGHQLVRGLESIHQVEDLATSVGDIAEHQQALLHILTAINQKIAQIGERWLQE